MINSMPAMSVDSKCQRHSVISNIYTEQSSNDQQHVYVRRCSRFGAHAEGGA